MAKYSVVMGGAALAAARDLISLRLPNDVSGYVARAGVYLGAAGTGIGAVSLNRGSLVGVGTAGAVEPWDVNDVAWDAMTAGATGTARGTQSATTLQDDTKNWATNQWQGHILTLVTGTGNGQTKTILSNTATTLTVSTWGTTPVSESTTYRIASAAAQTNLATTAATLTGSALVREGVNFGTVNGWVFDDTLRPTRLWIPPSGLVVLRLEAISASTTLAAELVVEVN